MRVIAVLGLSGVGKSTLIRTIAADVPLLHLQASDLIKTAQDRRNTRSTSDELRLGPVLSNQDLMTEEFRIQTVGFEGLVVFDGHSVVDTPNGLLEIPSAVFAALNLSEIIYLSENVSKIRERRSLDKSRSRPQRSEEELRRHQDQAITTAKQIAHNLRIEITIVSPDDYLIAKGIFIGEGRKGAF